MGLVRGTTDQIRAVQCSAVQYIHASTALHCAVRMHVRYGTFARLGGVDPTDHAAAAAHLPPVDSYDM
jgi:hypothetical protein